MGCGVSTEGHHEGAANKQQNESGLHAVVNGGRSHAPPPPPHPSDVGGGCGARRSSTTASPQPLLQYPMTAKALPRSREGSSDIAQETKSNCSQRQLSKPIRGESSFMVDSASGDAMWPRDTRPNLTITDTSSCQVSSNSVTSPNTVPQHDCPFDRPTMPDVQTEEEHEESYVEDDDHHCEEYRDAFDCYEAPCPFVLPPQVAQQLKMSAASSQSTGTHRPTSAHHGPETNPSHEESCAEYSVAFSVSKEWSHTSALQGQIEVSTATRPFASTSFS